MAPDLLPSASKIIARSTQINELLAESQDLLLEAGHNPGKEGGSNPGVNIFAKRKDVYV